MFPAIGVNIWGLILITTIDAAETIGAYFGAFKFNSTSDSQYIPFL